MSSCIKIDKINLRLSDNCVTLSNVLLDILFLEENV